MTQAASPGRPATFRNRRYDQGADVLIGGADRALLKVLGKQERAWGSPYTPSVAAFRCAPTSPSVEPASYLPRPTRFGELAVKAGLEEYGLSATQIGQIERAQGVKQLAPFAGLLGLSAFVEVLRRLHYSHAEHMNPPQDVDSDMSKADLEKVPGPVRLPARLLLCVPGHFRELARRTHEAEAAHTLESLGWVLMEWLRDQVAKQSGYSWWIPTPPPWVNASGYLGVLGSLEDFPLALRVQEQTLFKETWPESEKGYEAAFGRWRDGPAGTSWRLEVGLDKSKSGAGAGLPFYPEVVAGGIPSHVNTSADMAKMDAIWQKVLNDLPKISDPVAFLLNGGNKQAYLATGAAKMDQLSLGGLQLAYSYPILTKHRSDVRTRIRKAAVLSSLAAIFSSVFSTMYELGWNDLCFQLQGTFLFRGKKSKEKALPADKLRRAKQLSKHGYGKAVDINPTENPIGRALPRIDPRVVALFEAFGFTNLGCEPSEPDAMHFEYR
jgi:D-alanyl-D-alanine carboxypeptidase